MVKPNRNLARRSKAVPSWAPSPGQLASYVGKTSTLLRGGGKVEIVAEASGLRRMVVRAIGKSGQPVIFTVASSNLGQPQPSLFD